MGTEERRCDPTAPVSPTVASQPRTRQRRFTPSCGYAATVMDEKAIAAFAKSNCEPIRGPADGPAYRCSAYLTDGVYLPCVLIASKPEWLKLALRRFDEIAADQRRFFGRRRFGHGFDYASIVEVFVAAGNRVNTYDISRLEPSPYALPRERLLEIKGETSMSWTQFVGVMRDGSEFSFGTTFLTEFFDMPAGYTASDVTSIRPHERSEGELFRERPFFTCFVDGL